MVVLSWVVAYIINGLKDCRGTCFLDVLVSITIDPNSDIDIFCLQVVFVPKLQHHLDCFRDGWNNHRLRTEHNRTPHQLWILGLNDLASQTSNHSVIDGLSNSEVCM